MSAERTNAGRPCVDTQTVATCDELCGRHGEMCRVWCKADRKAALERGALLQVAGAARSMRAGADANGVLVALAVLDAVQSS